jgi:DEAD/DEAH box helicase domain-containing protein
MSYYIVYDTEACEIADDFKDNGVSYVAYYRSDTDKVDGYFEDKVAEFKKILQEADYVVGYNTLGYDYPVLEKYFQIDWRKLKNVDIFKLILNQHGIYLKLDNIAECTLGKNKIAHGLDAVRFYKEGKLDKLKEYCDMDVLITKQVYDYILQNGHVYYYSGTGDKIKIDVKLPDFLNRNEDKVEPQGLF